MRVSWLVFAGFGLAACSSGGGSGGGFTLHDAAIREADAGADASTSADAGRWSSDPEVDAGALGADDAGAAADAGGASKDAGPKGPLDPILEYTTCKPEEINPIVECITVTCPKAPDPIALVNCELAMCAPLVNKVNPKCKDCVTAAVAQDTAGLLENCLDLKAVTGTN
jgi:hypothetical protein